MHGRHLFPSDISQLGDVQGSVISLGSKTPAQLARWVPAKCFLNTLTLRSGPAQCKGRCSNPRWIHTSNSLCATNECLSAGVADGPLARSMIMAASGGGAFDDHIREATRSAAHGSSCNCAFFGAGSQQTLAGSNLAKSKVESKKAEQKVRQHTLSANQSEIPPSLLALNACVALRFWRSRTPWPPT
jgi:hypothetical protein